MKRFASATQLTVGLILICGGLFAMWAWHTQSLRFLQIVPSTEPMKFNTALCFFLLGLGITTLFRSVRLLTSLFSIGILFLSGMTLIETVFNTDFGIDQFFIPGFALPGVTYPGRMAPNTAICFILLSAALFLMSLKLSVAKRTFFVSTLAGLVGGISMVGLVGYLLHVPETYAWKGLTGMAILTALGFILASFFFLVSALSKSLGEKHLLPVWLPISIGITGITVTLILWQAIGVNEHARMNAEWYVLIFGGGFTLLLCVAYIFGRKARRNSLIASAKERESRFLATELAVLNQNLEQTICEKTRELASESARLRLAQGVAHIGTFEWNIETGVNIWTPELEKIYGLPPGTFPQTQPAWEKLVYPDDLVQAVEAVNRAYQTNDPVEGEWRVVWPDGSIHWVAGRFQAFKDASGKPVRLIGVNIDITQRKLAELALKNINKNLEQKVQERALDLQERDEKLRFALRSAHAGTWIWNVNTNEVEWDALMFSIFGVTPENFRVTFTAFLGLLHPEDRERTNKRVLEAVEKDRDFECEYRVLWRDGSLHHVLARGKCYRDNSGKPIHMYGICWDITTRKHEEIARLRAETKMRALLEVAPDSIVIVNRSGEIALVNSQVENVFGYAKKDLIGQNLDNLVPEQFKETYLAIKHEFLKGPQKPTFRNIELEAVHKNGGLIPVEVSLSPGEVEEESFVIAVVRDISARKQTESRLRTLAAVAESSNDFIGICNPDMSPFYVNEAGMKMMGLDSMEEVMKTRVLDYFWPEDRPMIENEAIPQLIKTGKWSGVCRFQNFRTGELIHTIWNTFLIKDASGSPVAWGTVSPNLNVLKASENKTRAALVEKEILLREIHHRVKNNLNVISGLLDLQARKIHNTKMSEFFRESQNRVISMALIHEKLYQSHNLAEIDFEQYVKTFIPSLYHSYGINPCQFTAKVDIQGVNLDIETAIPCSLIINELVSNSLKYAFPKKQHGEIFVGMHSNAGDDDWAYELVVADDGVGMPHNFSIDGSPSLGLKLVKMLTRQMGGILEIDSRNGTKFTIHFGKKNINKEEVQHVQ